MSDSIKIPSIYFDSTQSIFEFSQPLAKFSIVFFTYIRSYRDGSQLYLTNNHRWLNDYYRLNLYESSLFEQSLDLYQPGFFLWPSQSNLKVFQHGRESFNRGDGITFIEKSKNFTEFYFFSGLLNTSWLTNFFINNLELLRQFASVFKSDAQQLIQQATKHPIIIKNKFHNSHTIPEFSILTPPKKDLVLKKSPQHSSYNLSCQQQLLLPKRKHYKLEFDNKTVSLTRMEYECISHLLQGKTAKETADAIFRSHRTIEMHIENVKLKTDSRNKLDLLSKINKLY